MSSSQVKSILVTLMIFGIVSAKHYLTIAGPYKVIIKRVEKCSSTNNGPNSIDLNFEIRKRRGERDALNAIVSTPVYINDSLELGLSLSSWSNNGGWKPNAYQGTIKTPCKLGFEHYKPQVEYTMTAMFGEVVHCPIYPGLYRVYNFTIPEKFLQSSPTLFNQFMYGRWRAEGRIFTKAGDTILCLIANVDTIPR